MAQQASPKSIYHKEQALDWFKTQSMVVVTIPPPGILSI
jgi:hypothetical protein